MHVVYSLLLMVCLISSSRTLDHAIFGPLHDVQVFKDYYFEMQKLIILRRAETSFKGLLSFNEIQRIFRSMSASASYAEHSNFIISGHGEHWKLIKRVSKNETYLTSSFRNQTLDYNFVMRAIYRGGYSLVINRLQSKSSQISALVEHIRNTYLPLFGYRINVNLYLTPAGGNQGFEAHFDWMDVLVLQLTGCKTWKLYHSDYLHSYNQHPREDSIYVPSEQQLAALGFDVYDVSAGSTLYLTRGIIHEASTNCSSDHTNDPSVHLSIGIEAVNSCTLEMLLHHLIRIEISPNVTTSIVHHNTRIELFSVDLAHLIVYVITSTTSFLRMSVHSGLKLFCKFDTPLHYQHFPPTESDMGCLEQLLLASVLRVVENFDEAFPDKVFAFIKLCIFNETEHTKHKRLLNIVSFTHINITANATSAINEFVQLRFLLESLIRRLTSELERNILLFRSSRILDSIIKSLLEIMHG